MGREFVGIPPSLFEREIERAPGATSLSGPPRRLLTKEVSLPRNAYHTAFGADRQSLFASLWREMPCSQHWLPRLRGSHAQAWSLLADSRYQPKGLPGTHLSLAVSGVR